MTRVRRDPRDPDSFWDRVVPRHGGSGGYEKCWLWDGLINPVHGYGQVYFGQNCSKPRNQPAHRVAYELMIAEIPEGLVIDHLCRVRSCVNPWHLEPVTTLVNNRRGDGGVAARERKLAVTHCPRGHEYSPDNTRYRILKTGGYSRNCRICMRAQCRVYNAKRPKPRPPKKDVSA